MPPATQQGSLRTLTCVGPGLPCPQIAWPGRGLVMGFRLDPLPTYHMHQAGISVLDHFTGMLEGGGAQEVEPTLV